jgi:hypothetical protein
VWNGRLFRGSQGNHCALSSYADVPMRPTVRMQGPKVLFSRIFSVIIDARACVRVRETCRYAASW